MRTLMVIATCASLAAATAACKKEEKKAPAADPSAKTTEAPPPEPVTPEPPPAKPLTAEEKVKAYQDFVAAMNAKDMDKLKSFYAEDAESSAPDSGMEPMRGGEAIVGGFKSFVDAFPDATFEPQIILQSGNKVAAVLFVHGTHSATLSSPMGDMPATNKKIGVYGVHVAEMAPDRPQFVKELHVQDQMVFMGQLGLHNEPHRAASDKGMMAEPVVLIAKDDETEKANVAAYRTVNDLFNKHDVKALEAAWADDAKLIETSHPKDQTKKEGFANIRELFKGFPDISWESSEVLAAGDYVLAVARMKGTHTGNMKGMKKTGKPFDLTAIELVKFEGGKVKEDWVFFNSTALAIQLGMMEAPKGAAGGGPAATPGSAGGDHAGHGAGDKAAAGDDHAGHGGGDKGAKKRAGGADAGAR